MARAGKDQNLYMETSPWENSLCGEALENARALFFGSNLEDWIDINLEHELEKDSNQNWTDMFMVTIWNVWNWRNQERFLPPFNRPKPASIIIKNQIKDIKEAWKNIKTKLMKQKETRKNIKWEQPPQGWVKLNSDTSINIPN
ncbi:hypothetical protein PIB30_058949 [Stylosanthes scabra]|uniref:Uncharacterized protein n=1 Tax=Stylosanthes scabra TaxID=79078 RepID=A0ABU6ZIS8_9FABA|nr:hypothetical protein [Stylosanthes scabra]